VVDQPVGGDGLIIARAADAAGRAGKALSIFLRKMVGMSGLTPTLVGLVAPFVPAVRKYITRQLDDTEAINRLGRRLGAYAPITIPVLLFSGDRTPKSLVARTEALANMLPNGRRRVLRKQGHAANLRDPRQLAREIGGFAETVLRPPARSPGSTS